MPNTPLGLTYPDKDSHTRLWELFQTLAETADDAIGTAVARLGDGAIVQVEPITTGVNDSYYNPEVDAATFQNLGTSNAFTPAVTGITVPWDGAYLWTVNHRGGGSGGDGGWWSILGHHNGTAVPGTNLWFQAIGDNNLSVTTAFPLHMAAGDFAGVRLWKTPKATRGLNIYDGHIRVVYLGAA